MKLKIVQLLTLCALTAGCNNYTAPGHSDKAVSADQLAGQWRMSSSIGYLGAITLSADGSCSYKPTDASPAVSGTWSLNKSDFSATCGTLNVAGWLIDDSSGPSGVLIYGGDGDPDNYTAWDFVE